MRETLCIWFFSFSKYFSHSSYKRLCLINKLFVHYGKILVLVFFLTKKKETNLFSHFSHIIYDDDDDDNV